MGLGGRGDVVDDTDDLVDFLDALGGALRRIGVLFFGAGLVDELLELVLGSQVDGLGFLAFHALGLVLLDQDRLVVIGLGAVAVERLGRAELLLRLGQHLVEVHVVDGAAVGVQERDARAAPLDVPLQQFARGFGEASVEIVTQEVGNQLNKAVHLSTADDSVSARCRGFLH